jgi:hypothetical protein
MIKKYVKKPIEIEAVKWSGTNKDEVLAFAGQGILINNDLTLIIPTLEGNMEALIGDYIIKGVKGEFYPCKPDIFEVTYSPVVHYKPETVKLVSGLITQKYTYVEHEKDFNFNAPHHFKVRRVEDDAMLARVDFQEGAVKEFSINGVMGEDLIAMVICRLQHFQDSPFNCKENAMAITKLEEALMWLRKRTQDREARGVEGTHKV